MCNSMEGKLSSALSTPSLRPEDIEFPDLLRWVARNSNFDATSPPPKLDEEVLFESEVHPDPRDLDFLQLSPSPAIRALAERRSKEAQDKEKEGVPMIGKVPPSTICRVPMRQYSLSGDEIRQSYPGWTPDRPAWISKVRPNTRLYVTDSDAASLNSSVRESLVILSNVGRSHVGSSEYDYGYGRYYGAIYPPCFTVCWWRFSRPR